MHALEQTSIIIQLEQYINSIIPYDEIDNIEKDVLEKLSKDKVSILPPELIYGVYLKDFN